MPEGRPCSSFDQPRPNGVFISKFTHLYDPITHANVGRTEISWFAFIRNFMSKGTGSLGTGSRLRAPVPLPKAQ